MNENEGEIQPLTEFIASIDPTLPVCFLAFRPNFALENHAGADLGLMDRCVEIATQCGLQNAYRSGHTGISGRINHIGVEIERHYRLKEAQLAGTYAYDGGCQTLPRNCCNCFFNQACELKKYRPSKAT